MTDSANPHTEKTVGQQAHEASLALEPRHARVLRLLQERRRRDQQRGLSDDRVGWVTKELLAEEIHALTSYAPEGRSIGTYLSAINHAFRAAFGEDVKLLEYGRRRGVRLALDVVLIDRVSGDEHDDLRLDGAWLLEFPTGMDHWAFLDGPRPNKPR